MCGFCLPNPLVYLCVQDEVLAYRRPKVCDLVQYFKFVVVNSVDWWRIYILSLDIRLFQVDSQSDVPALKRFISMDLLLCVGCDCSRIHKQYVFD